MADMEAADKAEASGGIQPDADDGRTAPPQSRIPGTPQTNPGSAATLRSELAGRGLQFSRLQAALVTSLPQIIAVKFKPDGSERQLEATTKDVVARIASAKAHPPPPLMEKDLKQFNRFSLKHIGLGVRATTGAGAVPRISEASASMVERSSVAGAGEESTQP